MKTDRLYFSRLMAGIGLLAMIFIACGPAESASTGGANVATADPDHGSVHPPPPSTLHTATLWAHVISSGTWTAIALKLIRDRLPSLEKARDVADFCPSYSTASRVQKEVCWLRIIGGIVKFESGFKPTDTYRESNGVYSIGLMSLSAGECANAPRAADLKDPLKNLTCGVNMMASLIARDGYLDGPKGQRGAGNYWSTIRRPYSTGHARHGRKLQIIQLTKIYRSLAS